MGNKRGFIWTMQSNSIIHPKLDAKMGQTLNGHSLKKEPGRGEKLDLGKEQAEDFLAIFLSLLHMSRMVWISLSQQELGWGEAQRWDALIYPG